MPVRRPSRCVRRAASSRLTKVLGWLYDWAGEMEVYIHVRNYDVLALSHQNDLFQYIAGVVKNNTTFR